MKEISRQSLIRIHDLIYGQNYVNIKARLDQHLPEEYAKAFAVIKFIGNDGVWYGEKGINYQPFSAATADEKNEIAAWLKACKEYVCENLSDKMPWVHNLFIIPSQNEIYWYRNSDGEMQVTLAQWGFESKIPGHKVDIIGFLVSQPHIKSQLEVKIHIDYSDGTVAAEVPFTLNAFSNTKQVTTNENGEYHLGRLFAGRKFSVETVEGRNYTEFTVEAGADYNAIFDWITKYKIVVENQKGERKSGYELVVDGKNVLTDTDGCYEQEVVLQPDMTIDVAAAGEQNRFVLEREAENNVFRIVVYDASTPPAPPIPTPPVPSKEYIMVKLLDYDGEPLPQLSFVIRPKDGEAIEGQTDDNGEAMIDKSLFSSKKKYRIETRVTAQYRNELNKNKTKGQHES